MHERNEYFSSRPISDLPEEIYQNLLNQINQKILKECEFNEIYYTNEKVCLTKPKYVYDLITKYDSKRTFLLKMLIDYFSSLGEEAVQPLLELIKLNDELILLILENACIDALAHGLRFKVMELELKEGFVKAGEFDPSSRTIHFNPVILFNLLHELAHACVFFTFRSVVPKPANQPYAQRQTFFPRSREEFNPTQLKFQQCVRADKERMEKEGVGKYLFSSEIDDNIQDRNFEFGVAWQKFNLLRFFSNIQSAYNADLFNETALAEIFSVYMQTKAALLKLANDYEIDKQLAIAVLQRCLPKLYDYFETDIKRVLKHRLCYFMGNYMSGYKSQSLLFSNVAINSLMYHADINHLIRGFNYASNVVDSLFEKEDHLPKRFT